MTTKNQCNDNPCHHCPYFNNDCEECHQSDSVVEGWEDDFRTQFDELKLKPPKGSIRNSERELIIWYFRNLITTLKQTAQQEKEELCNNQDMNNAILRVVHELSSVKEPQTEHIVEATDSIIEVIKFFARVDGGKLHLTNLSDRAQVRGISVSDK